MSEQQSDVCDYWTDTIQSGYTAVRWYCTLPTEHRGYHDMHEAKVEALYVDHGGES